MDIQFLFFVLLFNFQHVLAFTCQLITREIKITFTANNKLEKGPRDPVYPTFVARFYNFLSKIDLFISTTKARIILNHSHLFTYFFK